MQFKRRSIKYTETSLFIFIWLVLFLSPIFVSNANESFEWRHTFTVWIRFSPFLVFSAINHFILIPWLFYKNKISYLFSAIVLLGALSLSLSLMVPFSALNKHERTGSALEKPFQQQDRLPPPPFESEFGSKRRLPEGKKSPMRPRPLEIPPWLNSLLIGFLVLGFDTGLRSTFKWSKIEQEKTQLEKEKVKNELAFLKNQLSPHFFMNTLNNIHSLIDIDSDEAKESIIRLSKLMRHLLYDSDEELIPLSKEVQFIQSYVDLMKLRFTEKVEVSFKVNVAIDHIKIPPLLFTSLIENAFKYGVSYQQASFVHISLSSKNNELLFAIINSKATNKEKVQNKETSGIGLKNTRKRLDLLYAENYEMKIDETDKTFSVDLKLPL